MCRRDRALRGQVEFSLLNESIKSIHEVWDIQIENSMLVNQNAFFVVTIRENSTLIYEASSKLFPLNSGAQYFNLAMLQPLQMKVDMLNTCLLYTSDAADERSSVDLGGRRIIKKQNNDDIVCTAYNQK